MTRKVFIILLLLYETIVASAQSKVIDSLQKIVALHQHDTIELNALTALSLEFLRKDLSKTKSYAHQTIVVARSLNSASQLGNGYFYLINAHQNSGQNDSALYYLDILGQHAKANPSLWKIEANYNQAAGLFYKNTGKPKKALPFMLKNLSLVKTENESKAGLYLNIGNIYYELGEFGSSSENFIKSLRLFEKLGNKRGQSYCLQSLGNTSFILKQFISSKEYFEKSLKLKTELKDSRGIISTNLGMGDVYKELTEFKSSEKYYLTALQLSREIKIPLEEARSLNQLGLLYKQMEDLEKAREYLKNGLQITKQIGDSLTSAKIKSEIIGIDLRAQETKQTEKTLITNLNTMIVAGDRNSTAIEYARLSDYYATRKQFDKAYYYQKKYEKLTDSIKGNAVVLQLKELEKKYSTEKKQQEIDLLKKDQDLQSLAISRQKVLITSIVIALISILIIGVLLINRYRIMNRNKRLLEIEKVRNNIARDLHDDMGSALSSINILSQVALVEKNDNTQGYLQRIGDQSARMMEDMSDMVWSINPRNDSMNQVIIRMQEFASEIFDTKNIEYQFTENSIGQVPLNAEQRKNLFLIYKESINNAGKYSEASKVEVNLQYKDNILELSVRDNGQGFDEHNIKAGNGLRNLRDRAKEINATLELQTAVGKGTGVVLKMPIA